MKNSQNPTSEVSLPPGSPIPVKVGMIERTGRQNFECEELAAPLKLIFIYHGQLGLDRGPEWIELNAGQSLLMRQNERSRAAIAYPPDILYYWLLFETALHADPDLPVRGKVARPRRVADLFQLLLEDQESGRLQSSTANHLVDCLFSEIRNNRDAGKHSPSIDEQHARRALAIIHSRFREQISTQDIAEELELSADHLGRVFRKEIGRTLVQEIQQTRLREARLHLLENRDTIDSVAAASGFNDAGYFRRVFRKTEGMSPAEFRNKFQPS